MTNEELNDRIIKLELCLQEAQNQMQTLQRVIFFSPMLKILHHFVCFLFYVLDIYLIGV